MKYNIYFTLKGAGQTIEAPNKFNPVEADNIFDCLERLSKNNLNNSLVEITGVRIVEFDDTPDDK